MEFDRLIDRVLSLASEVSRRKAENQGNTGSGLSSTMQRLQEQKLLLENKDRFYRPEDRVASGGTGGAGEKKGPGKGTARLRDVKGGSGTKIPFKGSDLATMYQGNLAAGLGHDVALGNLRDVIGLAGGGPIADLSVGDLTGKEAGPEDGSGFVDGGGRRIEIKDNRIVSDVAKAKGAGVSVPGAEKGVIANANRDLAPGSSGAKLSDVVNKGKKDKKPVVKESVASSPGKNLAAAVMKKEKHQKWLDTFQAKGNMVGPYVFHADRYPERHPVDAIIGGIKQWLGQTQKQLKPEDRFSWNK